MFIPKKVFDIGGVLAGSAATRSYLLEKKPREPITWFEHDKDMWVPYMPVAQFLDLLPNGEVGVQDVQYGSKRLQCHVHTIISHYATNTQYMILKPDVTPDDAIESFDITACMVSWTPYRGFKVHGDADPLDRNLIINPLCLATNTLWDWVRTVSRIRKYTARGWRLTTAHHAHITAAVYRAAAKESVKLSNISNNCMASITDLTPVDD